MIREEILRYLWSVDNPGVAVTALMKELDYSAAIYSVLRGLEAEGLARRARGATESWEAGESPVGPRKKAAGFGPAILRRRPDTWHLTDAGLAAADALVPESKAADA